jgi:transcriptional regulator with XRE-family HTH domain
VSDHPATEPDPASPQALVAELRRLRTADGNPTLEALARRTGVSKSVLSDNFSGKRLPSERTLLAIAHAFSVDAVQLLELRRALEPVARTETQPEQHGFGLRTVVAIAAAALVLGAGLGVAGTVLVGGSPPAAARAAPTASADAARIAVKSGEDPANTKCVNDAKVVAKQSGPQDTLLEIVYSAACHAAWSRIARYDNLATGNEVSTSIYRAIAPNAKDRQSTTEPDAQSAYTTLIVRPTAQTELCAVGSVTVSGQTIDFGKPVCL